MAQGAFANTTDVQNQFGVNNIAVWSNLSNPTPPVLDDARVQAGFTITDAQIISRFIDYGNYAYPLQPLGSDVFLLTRWSAVLCGCWLYFSRGLRDKPDAEGDPQGNQLSGLGKQVKDEIERYRAQDRLNAVRRWPTSSGPIVVATSGFGD